MKLKLSEWANIAEIIAAGVIVFSVIYLSYEINQNTRALQSDSYQNILGELTAINIALATDEEFHQIYRLGEKTPYELSELDWARFTQLTFSFSGYWEMLYLGRQNDSISPAVWSAFDPYFRGVVCLPGYQRFYEEQRHAHALDFIAYVETDAIPACLSE